MEMGDEAHDESSPSSAGSASAAGTNSFGQPAISAFDPLHGSASKKRSSPPAATFPPNATQGGVQLPPTAVDFGSRSRSASAQHEGGPLHTTKEEEAEALSYLNPAAVESPIGGATNNASLPPQFPFNGSPLKTTSLSNTIDQQSAAISAMQGSTLASTSGHRHPYDDFDFDDGIEAVQETDSEDDADRYDVADEENFAHLNLRATGFEANGVEGTLSPTSLSQRSNKSGGSGAAANNGALPTLPTGHTVINPRDPATISALANTTLKDPAQTAAAIAALGPNSLAALPTALHPLGQGVQISPSGRPYTPPSEKPFKCTVPGCDKSYKQQNGLKYHRLHGHCGQNIVVREPPTEKVEGKPYVCHVASCGKRYKKCVPSFWVDSSQAAVY